MVRWLLGLTGLALFAVVVGVVVLWPYLGIAGLWFGIWRRYRRLGRRQS